MNQLFVTCCGNLEPLLALELEEMGIDSIPGLRGVYIPKTLENVYKVNYLSRLAIRVLWPLKKFHCRDRHSLYDAARSIPWETFLNPELTFAIDSVVSHPNLKNSLFASLVVKDAICDHLRSHFGERPSIDLHNPDVQLHLFINHQNGILSFDTSGHPLYKRGWRTVHVEAPLQETLAAAILRFAKYTDRDLLCDPFCGSGTFLIEAAMMATNTPSGYKRSSWGFLRLPEHQEATWIQFKEKADKAILPLKPNAICGADHNPKAVEMAQAHAANFGFPIEIAVSKIQQYHPPFSPTLVVTNPPFGKRIVGGEATFQQLGKWLGTMKCQAAIISPDRDWIGRYIKKFDLSSGGFPVTAYLIGGATPRP